MRIDSRPVGGESPDPRRRLHLPGRLHRIGRNERAAADPGCAPSRRLPLILVVIVIASLGQGCSSGKSKAAVTTPADGQPPTTFAAVTSDTTAAAATGSKPAGVVVFDYQAVYVGSCEGDFIGEVEVNGDQLDFYIGGQGGPRELLTSTTMGGGGSFDITVDVLRMTGRIDGANLTGDGSFGMLGSDCPMEVSGTAR